MYVNEDGKQSVVRTLLTLWRTPRCPRPLLSHLTERGDRYGHEREGVGGGERDRDRDSDRDRNREREGLIN